MNVNICETGTNDTIFNGNTGKNRNAILLNQHSGLNDFTMVNCNITLAKLSLPVHRRAF